MLTVKERRPATTTLSKQKHSAVQISRPTEEGKTQRETHIEFGGALVERRAAANAGVHAGRGVLVVFACARALCALLAEDPELEQHVRRNATAA
jgi:hypothetical protein